MSTSKHPDGGPWYDPEKTAYENFERNLGLVTRVVKQHFYFDILDEDVLQIGREALWYSVQHFDPSLGSIPFGQFASRQIERKIRTYLTNTKLRHKSNSLPVDFDADFPLLDSYQDMLIVDAEFLATIPDAYLRTAAEDMLFKRSYQKAAKLHHTTMRKERTRRGRFIEYMKERYKDEFGDRQE